MAAKEASTPGVSPQVVPVIDAHETVKLVRESLRPLALIAGPLIPSSFAHRAKPQTGTARKDFLEGLVIALLAFAIGLAIGAALCSSRCQPSHPQEEQRWLN
jgi:hypothetical protein